MEREPWADQPDAGEGNGVSAETSAEELAALAAERPDLWNEITAHPNAYEGLRQWISEQAAPTVPEPMPAAPDMTAPAWPTPVADLSLPAPSGAPVIPAAPPLGAGPSPLDQAQPRAQRGKGLLFGVIASATVLLLAGAGAALAMTNTWPFGEGGPLGTVGGAERSLASQQEDLPTFADGLEARWTLTGHDLGGEAQLLGHLPRMMGPVNAAGRSDQPIQLESGVLVHYRPSDAGGDVPANWALLDTQTGVPIWVEEGLGYPSSCAINDRHTEAVCMTSFVDGSTLIGFGAGGILFAEKSEYGAVHYSNDAIQVSADSGVYLWSNTGELLREEPISTAASAGSVTNADFPECSWIYAADVISYIGPDCSAQDPESVLSSDESFNWALVDNEHPKIIIDTVTDLALYDGKTRVRLWKIEGRLPGSFSGPQIVHRESGDAVLVQRADGNAAYYVLVDLETGDMLELGGGGNDWMGVVAANQVLLFTGDPPYGEPLNRVQVFDPDTGEKVAEHDFPAVHDVADFVGGTSGVLLGHPKCHECSTAEGSHIIDSYTFMGPADDAGGSAEESSDLVIPASIPVGCPTGTLLLAWAELDDGWLLVCGITLDEPSFVAYQPAGGGPVEYSVGWKEPTRADAKAAVDWDPITRRYTAELENGERITCDYDIGTVTLRDTAGGTTLEQQRLVRYLFVVIGERLRTLDDTSGSEGVFEVATPDDTAEDQVRYMIEVLEKAYAGRSMVKDAVPKLRECSYGPGGYGGVLSTMQAVRDNRAELLEALASMPVDKIPEGTQLLDDLTEGIRHSHTANIAYVEWAENANRSGCASLSPDGQKAVAASDAPKERFADRWNRAVAPKYGVRTFDGWYI